jgi:hypothetical protein
VDTKIIEQPNWHAPPTSAATSMHAQPRKQAARQRCGVRSGRKRRHRRHGHAQMRQAFLTSDVVPFNSSRSKARRTASSCAVRPHRPTTPTTPADLYDPSDDAPALPPRARRVRRRCATRRRRLPDAHRAARAARRGLEGVFGLLLCDWRGRVCAPWYVFFACGLDTPC